MQIGMIGLGRMGANMARRLIRKGHTCVVFNRSPQAVIRIFQDLLATSPTLVKDAGPLRLRSMKQYRPQFSRRRFMSDSVLGARTDFANKLLSAMRYEFGGHLEKSDGKSKVA